MTSTSPPVSGVSGDNMPEHKELAGVRFYTKLYRNIDEETNSPSKNQIENPQHSDSNEWDNRLFTTGSLEKLPINPLSSAKCIVCTSIQQECKHSIRHGRTALPRTRIQDIRNASLAGCSFCAIIYAAIEQFSSKVLERDVYSLEKYCHLTGAESGSWWEWAVEYPNQGAKGTAMSTFEIFTDVQIEDGLWSFLQCRSLVSDPTSPEFAQMIAAALDLANEANIDYSLPKSAVRPSRVLAISSESTGGDVRLVELPLHDSRYAALSHCWGRDQPIRTLRENLTGFKERIPWDSLPLLFQQAITVARRVQLDYIWIDSLCIIQDDDSDWAAEASIMGDIYHNASITLLALEAEDSTQGLLPCPVKQVQVEEIPTLTAGDRPPLWVRSKLEHFYLSTEGASVGGPLSLRAWTFQELLLSRNLVAFAPDEIIWQSPEVKICDCLAENTLLPWVFDRIISRLRENDKRTRAVRDSYWHHQILRNFLERNITYDTDRLPALSGIAKRFLVTHPGYYVAGLWTDQLPLSLLWRVHPRKWGASRRVPGVPTWSWASLAGSWRYGEPPSMGVTCTARVVGMSCKFKHADPTGAVDGGSITLEGKTVTAHLKFVGPNTVPRAWLVRGSTIANADVDLRYDDGSDASYAKEKRCYIPSRELTAAIVGLSRDVGFNKEVTCIEIANGPNFDKVSSGRADLNMGKVKGETKFELWRKRGIWGLVLLPSKQTPEQFVRVGVSWMPSSWFWKASVRKVVVI